MEEEYKEKNSGVITTKVENERVILTIRKQSKYSFNKQYYFRDGILIHSGTSDRTISIASQCYTEYHDGSGILYLKGTSDSCQRNKQISMPLTEWVYFKQALEECGFAIDPTEEEIKEVDGDVDFSDKLEEPTEDEINKMISLVDLDTFTKIIKSRLVFDTEGNDDDNDGSGMPLEKLALYNRGWAKAYLRQWAISKYRFYKLLGDKLTISEEIEVPTDERQTRTLIDEIKAKFPLYRPILEYIPPRYITNNRIIKDGSSIFQGEEVKDGMKFTKFMSLYGNKDLDMEISKIYQDLGKATIYISINPIDYLTVSINASGWESCHNFFHGCYRNAGLGYMFDYTSLVAYSSRKELEYHYYSPFKWNSKCWRQMIYISPVSSTMIFSRQYPYGSDEITKAVRLNLEEKMSKLFNAENEWKVYGSVNDIDVVVNNYPVLYNDIKNGYGHKVVRNKKDMNFNKSETINIGVKITALNNEKYSLGENENLWQE